MTRLGNLRSRLLQHRSGGITMLIALSRMSIDGSCDEIGDASVSFNPSFSAAC